MKTMMKYTFCGVLAIIFLLSGCNFSANSVAQTDPFGHIYRVTESVIPTNTPAEYNEKILVNLDVFHNLWIMEDTATYDFTMVGELKASDLDEGDTRKGMWSFVHEDTSLCYDVTVEADDSVVLSQRDAQKVCWSYQLSRVDMLSVNVSTFGKQELLEIDWYFADTFLGDLSQLSSGTISGKGKIGFSVDDSVENLTVVEEYYTDGNAEYTEYQLTRENGFHISARTRYDTGVQYAIYRVPYDNGEYLFYVKYI